jgi:nicotinate dehydrogenase subunit B
MTTRRAFLKIGGGGIIVLCAVDLSALVRELGAQDYPTDFNVYLRIGEDGRVTLFTGKIEMGQGVYTSLPQVLAEELDVPLASIDPVMGDTELCPWDSGTSGSRTMRFFGPALRNAAATARRVLLELGSERLGVPVQDLSTRDGAVFETGHPDHVVTYAELARGRRIERTARGEASPKPLAEHVVCGTPTLRLDAALKVTGRARYAADLRLPGLLHAKLLRPPAHGSRLVDVDTSGAEEVEGARVVRDGDLIAILHQHPDVAEAALERVRARWDTPAGGVDDDTLFTHLEASRSRPQVVTEAGSIEAGRAEATRVEERTYRARYVAHAPIEPHAAVASVKEDGATVWASTQNPFPLRAQIADVLGWPEERVRVVTPFVGGAFGGKNYNAQAVEAVRVARLADAPVSLAWSRKEEFFYDKFRQAAIVRVAAGLRGDSRLAFWDYANMHGTNRGSRPVYDVGDHRVTFEGGGDHPLATGAWRAPGANVNHFAIESHIDVMASAAGTNPLDFRLANLQDPRMRGVLRAVADRCGVDMRPTPSGRGVGLACGVDAGTYVAATAEVEVDRERGTVRVARIVCAQDMGEVINPEGARLQVEGCLTMGLGYALSEEVHFGRGAIAEENFDTYGIPRFSWVPEIEVVLVDNPDIGPQGGGEPAIVIVGAVLANAIHDALGVRVYELPMTPARIRRAVAEA